MPVEKVTALIGQVTPAFLSANQSDHAGLRRYLLTLTEGIALITFPATIGMALVTKDFVSLVLGERWSGVVAPLEVLAFYGSVRSVSALLGSLLTVLRETRFLMWTNVMAAILMPTAFYFGSRWGPVGIAWGWIVAYPLVAGPLYVKTFRRIGMSARQYLKALRPALDASLAMVVAVGVLKWMITPAWTLYTRFAIEVSGGAAVYLIVLLALHGDRWRSFLRLYRSRRASNGPPPLGATDDQGPPTAAAGPAELPR